MTRILQISVLLFCSVILFDCKKDESSPTQPSTNPQSGDTVAALPPGGATIDFYAHFQWSDYKFYNQSSSCVVGGDSLFLRSSFSLQTNSYSIEVKMPKPTATGTITLSPTSSGHIKYTRVLYGLAENYSTRETGTSGSVVVTYLNANTKTLKGTFQGTLKLAGSSTIVQVTNGIFKGTW
jgi:hypothetical protein